MENYIVITKEQLKDIITDAFKKGGNFIINNEREFLKPQSIIEILVNKRIEELDNKKGLMGELNE